MYDFLDTERAAYGVEPICRVLAIASSGYDANKKAEADASPVCQT